MSSNNMSNQLAHQSTSQTTTTILPIPLVTTDSANNINKNPTIIQIATPVNTANNIENANTALTTSTGHVKLSNSIKINQLPLNLSSSSIVLTQPSSSNSPSSSTNQGSAQNNSSSNSYGGFAYCSNCREYGVKAAFYGKSKLYCSVACQNGIKKQQQQQNQGVKRTIEALNYSPNNQSSSPTTIIQQHNPINIAHNNSIPTLIPISSQVIQSNLATGTPTILIQESNNPKISELLSANSNNQNGNKITLKSIDSSSLTIQKSNNNENTNKNSYHRTNSVPNNNNINSNKSLLSSSISSTIDSVINSLDTGNINPPPSKRQRNNSVQSNSANSTSSNDSTKLNSTPNNQFNRQRSVSINNKSPSVSPTAASKTVTAAFNWPSYIEKEKTEAAPVSFFKHSPLNDFWHKILNNIYVEVPNKDPPDPNTIEDLENFSKDETKKIYWFASVIHYAGYYAKLRYVGFEKDDSNDFWLHMCDPNIHPIGWAAENEIPLVPPNSISKKHEDWKTYLIDKMTGFKTLPKTFHEMVQKSLKSKFQRGMILELVDKNKVSRMRVGKIIENIGGRIRMKYENADCFDDFWCHEQSEIIHPIGWSMVVGHDIYADEEYKKNSAEKYLNNKYEANECGKDMFKIPREVKRLNNQFKVNMKLEAIDPLNLSSIGVATIGKVLKENYLMIKLDGYKSQDGNDLFCYHRTSSSIFPAGFCEKNSLDLLKPIDYKKPKFDWPSYLEETNSQFAPIELFYDETSFKNPFKVGMKLESVDLMEPKMICVATVVAVVNRLIKLNFDGWTKDYDQWIDCESCDLFPIGWCELVNYPLQPPNQNNGNTTTANNNSNMNDIDSSKKKPKRTYNKKK